jgi:hypothetical protein
MIKRWKRAVLKLSILLLSIALVLLLCELYCAVFVPCTNVTTDILGRDVRAAQAPVYRKQNEDGIPYYDLEPNQERRLLLIGDRYYHYATNSLGIRGPEITITDPDQFRILVLGDSQTFGIGLDQDKTFSAQLEVLLHEKGHNKARVFNGGVPGYGTFDALWRLKKLINEVRPHVVLAVVYVDNALVPTGGCDLWDNYVRLLDMQRKDAGASAVGSPGAEQVEEPVARAKPAKISFLAQHSHLYGLLSRAKNSLFQKSYAEQVKQYRLENSQSEQLRMIWDRTRSLLQEMSAVAQVGQAKLVIMHLPGIASLEMDDLSALEELEKTRLPVVSLFAPLQKERQNDSRRLRFKFDSHYNEKVQELIAQQLADYFIAHDLAGPTS